MKKKLNLTKLSENQQQAVKAGALAACEGDEGCPCNTGTGCNWTCEMYPEPKPC